MDKKVSLAQTTLTLLLLGATLALFFTVFSLNREVKSLETRLSKAENRLLIPNAPESEPQIITQIEERGTDNSGEIVALRSYVDAAVATLSGVTTKTVSTVTTPATVPATPSKKTSFLSMGTSYSTTSTDWVDVPDSKVYIDLINDYGSNPYVTWEASLKVAHGNGQAFVRLYDETNKIAVVGSELSTTNNSEYKQVYSGSLALWRGNNLYKVQIKSLNSFSVTYSSGRIKVSY
jgi:hypothetical protein